MALVCSASYIYSYSYKATFTFIWSQPSLKNELQKSFLKCVILVSKR